MTKTEVVSILKELNIPFAYDHFAEGNSPRPPFCVYLYPNADNFSADGIAYFKKDVLSIEIYTDKKDLNLEERVEGILEKYGLFYSKSEVWIQTEKLYEVLYKTEV